jgi:hypothetical protein
MQDTKIFQSVISPKGDKNQNVVLRWERDADNVVLKRR